MEFDDASEGTTGFSGDNNSGGAGGPAGGTTFRTFLFVVNRVLGTFKVVLDPDGTPSTICDITDSSINGDLGDYINFWINGDSASPIALRNVEIYDEDIS